MTESTDTALRSLPFKKLCVIINPAAGVDRPILGSINNAFKDTDVFWDVKITHKAGDAQRLAKEAVEEGFEVVAAHGGDGTVMEVAYGLFGSNVPLAIFPGGTIHLPSRIRPHDHRSMVSPADCRGLHRRS